MLNGIINVYKEEGFTSNDVVARLRGILHQRKIGHAGTLDPAAVGVLPVLLGSGCRISDFMMDHDKTYHACLLLGVTTDTQDMSGEILAESGTDDLTEETVREAVMSFVGEYDQIPPMYSALKKDGRRLYDIARSGQVVERESRKVTIRRIEVLDISLPVVKIKVLCSKGTYIRTLCDDIGRDLGCGGCMQSLVRSKVGPFTLDNAVILDDIRHLRDEGREDELMGYLLSIDTVFEDLPSLTVSDEAEKKLRNGNKLLPEDFTQAPSDISSSSDKKEFRIYHCDGSFAAVYEFDFAQVLFSPVKMF